MAYIKGDDIFTYILHISKPKPPPSSTMAPGSNALDPTTLKLTAKLGELQVFSQGLNAASGCVLNAMHQAKTGEVFVSRIGRGW